MQQVPIGANDLYCDKEPLKYQWKGDNFYVLFNGKYESAESTDFVFEDPYKGFNHKNSINTMNREKLREKALKLLEPFENRYYPTLSEVHWVEKNEVNTDGDYCDSCVEKALKEKQREEKKMRKVHNVTSPEPEFSTHGNYGGGYEDCHFSSCDICGKELNITILPSEENIQDVIDDLKDGKITDQLGYRAYSLIYNEWKDGDNRHKEAREKSWELTDRVIEILKTKKQ